MTKEQLGSLILDSQDSLYRVAKSLLQSDADCADAIHEAIVKAFAGFSSLKNDAYARTWLTRILINECYMVMRRQKKIVSLDAVPESAAYEARDYSALYAAISRLPRDMRMAVVLYYIEGFSVKEIAAIEDTTPSAVKNRLYKARARLKIFLENEEAESI